MLSRLITRIFWSAVTLLGTATLTFLLINIVPGDVARMIAGPKATPQVLEQVRVNYHLRDPMAVRFGHYLSRLAHGDLGRSYATDETVTRAILSRFPATAALAAVAVVMWLALAVPWGVFTATRAGTWVDRLSLLAAVMTFSFPAFWLARMLQYWLAYKAGWFPVAGLRGFTSLLLPGATLAILSVGYYSRLVHTSLLEVLNAPYLTAARAKGASETVALFRHGLRNALIPVVTVLGMDVAGLLTGVIFTENIFALPGIGTLAVQSVFNLDVPMIMGVVLFSAALVVGANLVVDLLYRWIDPRIKQGH